MNAFFAAKWRGRAREEPLAKLDWAFPSHSESQPALAPCCSDPAAGKVAKLREMGPRWRLDGQVREVQEVQDVQALDEGGVNGESRIVRRAKTVGLWRRTTTRMERLGAKTG